MSRIVYVNGEFVDEADARISIFDRGFLFADAVYEVTSVIDGKLIDNDAHLERLGRSLRELKLDLPTTTREITAIQRALIARNGLVEGGIYLQVSRGEADRDFAFPDGVSPSLVMFTQARNIIDNPAAEAGIAVITIDDIRWKRRDVKTVQLLAASLAKQAAAEAGANDAWMVENGLVTEGTSNNAWIVTGDRLVTRHLSNEILHGITRRATMRLARDEGITVEERAFSVAEALAADEAFVTSASAFVLPVVSIDGQRIGKGEPGPLTRRLRELYIAEARASDETG